MKEYITLMYVNSKVNHVLSGAQYHCHIQLIYFLVRRNNNL